MTNEQHLQIRLDDELNMGHLEIVRQLLEQGADVNAKDAHGDTPLMVAAYTGQADAVRLLLEFGADTNAKNYIRNDNGITAREIAQELGHQEVLLVFSELSVLKLERGTSMANSTSAQSAPKTDQEYGAEFELLMQEAARLNELMDDERVDSDRAEIERLKIETRMLRDETRRLLASMGAKL